MAEPDRVLLAEQALAGACLLSERAVDASDGVITSADFAYDLPRAAWAAARALHLEGKPVDPVTVMARMEADGVPTSREYMVQLMDAAADARNAPAYAAQIRRNAVSRQLQQLGQQLEQEAWSQDPEELISASQARLARLETASGAGEGVLDTGDLMQRFYAHRQQLEQDAGRVVVRTGLTGLDQLLGGGLLASGLYILAARPGMGKTSLALSIADRVEGEVLVVSLEMDPEQLASKLAAMHTGISSTQLLEQPGVDYQRLSTHLEPLLRSRLHVWAPPSATVAQIRRRARKLPGLRLVVIDYLGLLRPDEPRRDRYGEITDISAGLKRMARELGCPVLALCQLNRAGELTRDKRPQLSHLRDSGAVEQDADGVLLAYRPDYYADKGERPKPWDPVLMELELAKNRHGPTGRIRLTAYLATCRFETAVVQHRDKPHLTPEQQHSADVVGRVKRNRKEET